MKSVGIIPARWGSTRFPGKSLALLAGKPLILRVLDRVRGSARLDRVIVATDDQRIGKTVAEAGGSYVLTRSDHPSGTDRIAEAVQEIEADIVVNIQGDEPFIDPGLIDRIVDALQVDRTLDMCTAACPFQSKEQAGDPSAVKVVCDEAGRALYFSRYPIPYVRDNCAPPALHRRHIGIYGYRRSFLETFVAHPPSELERAEKLEQLRALHMGAFILVLDTASAGAGIDTPEDLAYAEKGIGKEGQGNAGDAV
jgi:3-deoxy-manno-octulosonate cytidylyltransferase (CMP-KDO synthetase)